MAGSPFYVGYRATSPPELARFTRRIVACAVTGGLVLGALLAALQRPFEPGVFEFLEPRPLSGTVLERPYPALHLAAPGGGADVHLVLPGKHGAAPITAGLVGHHAELRGKLIYRGGRALAEVVPGSLAAGGSEPGGGSIEALGTFELAGEIVDSKCYLGVMKPGREKTHRACAALCIRGGIPPLLAVEDPPGDAATFLLADAQGGAIGDRLLPLVGEPVLVTGRVERRSGALWLLADPAAYRPAGRGRGAR